MRYKCVIPMVVDQEREKQQKKEEEEKTEEDLTVIGNEYVNETEINESKNRVYEHFKQICEMKNKQVEIPSKKKKKSKQLILSQMHGRKRKREFDVGNENQKKNDDNDFCTPIPYLDAGTVHMSKKAKREAREAIEERKIQESLTHGQGDNNSETVKSIR